MPGLKRLAPLSPAPMGEDSTDPQRIILTGATGFIGTHLQHELLGRGHDVAALVRPGSTRAENILDGVRRFELALDNSADLTSLFTGADVVIHCAGCVRGRHYDDFVPANVTAVQTLAAAAVAMAKPRVLLVSSLAASRPHLSDYARSKHAGEEILRQTDGVEWVVLRPPAVYGPGDREMRPLLQSIRRGLAPQTGPGEQRLSLLYAGDLARAVAAVVDQFDACAGGTFELDDGLPGGYDWPLIIAAARGRVPVLRLPVPRALLTALAHINAAGAAVLGYAPMLTPGKVRELSESSWLCDNQALVAASGWQPQVRLREGVEATFGTAPENRM